MSVLTKGLAMDFVRQGRKEMAISSVWPAAVSPIIHALSAGRLTTWQSIESAATEVTFANNDRLKNDLRKPVGPPLNIYMTTSANTLQTVFSDAILGMLNTPAETVNGLLETDEDFLRKYRGMTDFSAYSVVPGASPRRIMPQEFPVLEVAEQDDEGSRVDSTKMRSKL